MAGNKRSPRRRKTPRRSPRKHTPRKPKTAARRSPRKHTPRKRSPRARNRRQSGGWVQIAMAAHAARCGLFPNSPLCGGKKEEQQQEY